MSSRRQLSVEADPTPLPSYQSPLGSSQYSGYGHNKESFSFLRLPVVDPSEYILRFRLLDPLRFFCVLLHVMLIITFVALAAAKHQDLSPPQTDVKILSIPLRGVAVSDTGSLSSTLTTIISTLVTGYGILLTLTTQRLALRRQLHLPGTLTSKHDTSAAWSGLGGALLMAIRHRRPYALTACLIPIFYLGGISILHAITPGLMNIQVVNSTTSSTIATRGIPDVTETLGNFFLGPSSLLTLSALSTAQFPGLSNSTGTIYDVPFNDTSDVSDNAIHTQATYFNVTCGTVSGIAKYVPMQNNPNRSVLRITLDLYNPTPFAPYSLISQGALSVDPAPWTTDAQTNLSLKQWPGTLMVFTPVPVVDSFGHKAPSMPLDQAFTYQKAGSTDLSGSVSAVTVLACNLTLNTLTASISPVNHSLFSLDRQTVKTWSQLAPFGQSQSPLLNLSDPDDALSSAWGVLFQSRDAPLSPLSDRLQCSEDAKCLKEPDQFLMDQLGLLPDIFFPEAKSAPNITLHELENAMSRMSAIAFWAEANGDSEAFTKLFLETAFKSENISAVRVVQHTAPVNYSIQSPKVLVNLFHIYGGLVLAVALFVLALPGIIDTNAIKVAEIGILEVIWLLREAPEAQSLIQQTENPKQLREVGEQVEISFGVNASRA